VARIRAGPSAHPVREWAVRREARVPVQLPRLRPNVHVCASVVPPQRDAGGCRDAQDVGRGELAPAHYSQDYSHGCARFHAHLRSLCARIPSCLRFPLRLCLTSLVSHVPAIRTLDRARHRETAHILELFVCAFALLQRSLRYFASPTCSTQSTQRRTPHSGDLSLCKLLWLVGVFIVSVSQVGWSTDYVTEQRAAISQGKTATL
jgi:hypothetical protein